MTAPATEIDPTPTRSTPLGRSRYSGWTPALVRVLSALLIGAVAVVHLELWQDGYRGIRYIGPLFLANVIGSGIVVALLLLRAVRPAAILGMVIAVGSFAGLVLSRTVGLLGFMESGWTPLAFRSVAAELGAVVSLAVALVLRARSASAAPRAA